MTNKLTFNHHESEYVDMVNILTDVIRICPEIRQTNLLSGDNIMLTNSHQLSIESNGYNRGYTVKLNRLKEKGWEYLIVDDGYYQKSSLSNVNKALEEFYEELAFYAPDEHDVDEVIDIYGTLEALFNKYKEFINTEYSSTFI